MNNNGLIFKDEQIANVARKLNLQKKIVKDVLEEYIGRLLNGICAGKTVKVFNICYLRVNKDLSTRETETLAYTATEVGKVVGVPSNTAYRCISSFTDQIVTDLQRDRRVSIRGLIRVQLNEDGKLRVKKSTSYNGNDVYVITLGSFKRKVETYARKNS